MAVYTDLVDNGDFSGGHNGAPDNDPNDWTITEGHNYGVQANSNQLYFNGGGVDSTGVATQVVGDNATVSDGLLLDNSTATLSFDWAANGSNSNTVSFEVRIYDDLNNLVFSQTFTEATSSNATHSFTTSFNVGTSDSFRIEIEDTTPNPINNDRDIWVDDIQFEAWVVCFAKGTTIETAQGPVRVEDLREGDMVVTMDRGLQPIRWIGSQKVKAMGKLAPVRIMAGALGNGLPKRDLLVSRQHRMLVSSRISQRMFDSDVLIPAIKLTELPGIYIDESIVEVEYFHILFHLHEVIFAEGAPSESLYTGPEALKAVSPKARAEIL